MSMYTQMKERRKNKKLYNNNETSNDYYDLNLISKIQPRGGVTYKNDFSVRKGTGHETCITIYETPTDVEDFWLGKLMTMDNSIVTFDISSKSKQESKSDIQGGVSEYLDRMNNDRDAVSRNEAAEGYNELLDLLRNIRNGGESIKSCAIRIFVSGRTEEELDNKVNDILIYLNSLDFKGAVYMNEQKFESQSLTMNLSQQDALLPRIKKDIPSQTIATGVPFHSVSLNDPYGTYYGTSDTGGNIILDLYHKDSRRTSYDAVLVGNKGVGKSHTLKLILLKEAIQGNRIRIIDSTGEFINLVKILGGKTISLDGTDGMINPLEVNAVAVKEYENELGQMVQKVDENTSFAQHKQKLETFYGLMNEAADSQDKQLFILLLDDFYRHIELWGEGKEITNLKANEYPTMSDLLDYLQKEKLYEDIEARKLKSNLSKMQEVRYQNIEIALENIIRSTGHMFDGHTTIDNFKDHSIINFSIRQLNSMSDNVKKAQLFNVMNLLFDEMVYFGTPQFQAFNRDELDLEDVVRYRLIFDEAHNLISASDKDAPVVDKCEKFIREDRKYFAGFIFASQDIKDFVPEGSAQVNIAKVKTLFSQTTYRFIMRQDTSNIDKLSEIFSQELSSSELEQIPRLATGEAILNISGVKNVKFKIEISDEQNELFGGGA